MTRGFRDEDDEDEPDDRFEGVRCKRETDKALLVRINGENVWVPKSVVGDESEVYAEGHEGTLVLRHWFADKEGLV